MSAADEPASFDTGAASSSAMPGPAWTDRARQGSWNLGRIGFWIGMMGACTASGALYGAIQTHGHAVIGMVYGFFAGGSVLVFDQGVVLPGLRFWVRRLPMAPSVLVTEAFYMVLIILGTVIAGSVVWATGLHPGSWPDAIAIDPITMLYALVVAGTLITLSRLRELIGGDVFRNLLMGRYYHPKEEERIFLFLDLIGSTAYAQRHGDLKAQAFLGAIFTALAEPVRRNRGSIDDYVGDMALVTWTMATGTAQARCVACIFDFLDAIARDARRWHRDFGQVPQFRAALHGGGVVTAEVGLDRRKIAYFGDVVNTTGRLEGLCRHLDVSVLVSSDLLDRMPVLPAGVAPRPLGSHAVKGRGQSLSVFALEPAWRLDEPPTPRAAPPGAEALTSTIPA